MKEEQVKTVEEVQLVTEADEEYSSRPKTKPEKVIRGKLLIWPDTKQYYFEGRKEHPEMKREVMHDKNGVKIAKTVGEKEQSYILTAKCSGDVADFESLLCHKVIDSLKGKLKNEPQFSKPQYLIDRPDDLQAWVRKKDKKLRCLLTIDLDKPAESAFMDLSDRTAEINKIIFNSKNILK